ncbi:MAG: S8 family serine peptidase [Alphaproteobacteria bacterium]
MSLSALKEFLFDRSSTNAAQRYAGSEFAMSTLGRDLFTAPVGVPTIMGADGEMKVGVDIAFSETLDQAMMAKLLDMGLENYTVFNDFYVSGFFPVDQLEDIFALGAATTASLAAAVPETGSVTSQDVAALNVDDAVARFGVDGSGITVGVMSDSFDFFGGGEAAGIASGDLPAEGTLIIEEGVPLSEIGDEGRAMAELIFDIAPGVSLQFATAVFGQAGFANNILALAAAGSDIIVDDISVFADPFYADGIIGQAIDQVAADGVSFFSSGGNGGNLGYQGAFESNGATLFGLEAFDFDPGEGVDPFFDFQIGGGDNVVFNLQWANAYASTSANSPGATGDFDLLLFQRIGEDLFFIDFLSSIDPNLGADPIEIISFGLLETAPTFDLAIGMVFVEGEQPDDLRFIVSGSSDFQDTDILGGPTTFGHSTAEGSLGTAAVIFDETPEFGVNPPELASFSSIGPATIRFDIDGNPLPEPDVRLGVEIAASNGGNTTFFFSDSVRDDDDLPNFFGTSAAAPNAAAIAALMTSINPSLTPEEIADLLRETAIDMDDPTTEGFDVGPDFGSGFGYVQADVAVQEAFDTLVDAVSVNDWFNEDTGFGGFIATFELTTTDGIVGNGAFEAFELDIDLEGGGEFVTGSFQGFPGPVSFDAETGTFSNVSQGFKPTIEAGETLTFSIQVQGAGFNIDNFNFLFLDLDPEPALPESGPDTDLVAESAGLNDWGQGVVQRVDVINEGEEAVDGWIVKLELGDMEMSALDNLSLDNVWNADAVEADGDVFFFPKSYNSDLDAGESIEFGFQANVLDNTGVPYDEDTAFEIVSLDELPDGLDIPDSFTFV